MLKKVLARRGLGASILIMALVPSLVTAMLLTALLVREKVVEAEANARTGLLSAARNLASASQYGLISGNQPLLQQVVDTSRSLERLAYVQVRSSESSLSVQSGALKIRLPDRLPAAGVVVKYPDWWISASPITLPSLGLENDEFGMEWPADSSAAANDSTKIIGYALVAISTAPVQASQREAWLLAAGLALASAILTALIAWRMSTRLTRRFQHIAQTVNLIAGGELDARVAVQPIAELGLLEEGINHMAQSLRVNRDELQTRINEATADLQIKKNEAEQANVAKSRFFAAASHDLRQPLHALSLFSEVLEQKIALQPDSQNLAVLATQITSSVSSMQALLNALLDVSRLDANIIEVRMQHFSVSQIFERINQQYSNVASNKGLVFRIRMCHGTLHSDPVLLERILLNLVSNAIRNTQTGGVLIRCKKRGENLLIQVWDSGAGIPHEEYARIFQEFVQLDNPERDRNKGLGLGLAIVSRMANLLGIPVQLHSRVGRGSMFSISVPIGHAQEIAPPEPTQLGGISLQGLLGVVVDDEDNILDAMRALFGIWKIDLVAARSAGEALHQLQKMGRRPDFLLSDFRLPGNTDGIEVAQQFRTRYGNDFPAVILTGDTAPETLQRITLAGYLILHKPVRPARLRATLMHMLS